MVRAAALKARESISQTVKDDLLTGKKASSSWRPAPEGGYVKRKRCGECEGCNAANCGKCDNCRDMPCYGGKGTKRQSCRMRLCTVIDEEDTKLREEREKERKVRQAEREAEREKLRAEREANRPARKHGAGPKQPSGSRRAAKEARELAALVGRAWSARLPAVRLEHDLSGGWGRHSTPKGTEVEVRLAEEGMENALWEGRVVGRRLPDADDDPTYGDEGAGARTDGGVQLQVEFDELLADNGEEESADEAGDEAAAAGGSRRQSQRGREGAPKSADEKLLEWVSPNDVRLRPPGKFPPGVIELVRAGDLLELYYEDAWWAVEVKGVAPRGAQPSSGKAQARGRGRREEEEDGSESGAQEDQEERFTVIAVGYNKVHRVPGSALRPRWLWAADSGTWRFELLVGHGCVPLDAERLGGRPTFKFAHGAMRSRNSGN